MSEKGDKVSIDERAQTLFTNMHPVKRADDDFCQTFFVDSLNPDCF